MSFLTTHGVGIMAQLVYEFNSKNSNVTLSSVQGEHKYFVCNDDHGLLCVPEAVTLSEVKSAAKQGMFL